MLSGWRRAVLLVLVLMFSALSQSCGWIGWVYRPVTWNIDDIEQGMDKKEVRKILGEPWSKDGRQWRYRQMCRLYPPDYVEAYCEESFAKDLALKLTVYNFTTLVLLTIPNNFWWQQYKYYMLEFDSSERLMAWCVGVGDALAHGHCR